MRKKAKSALVQKVDKLLVKYGVYFLCSFRFLYGVRTLTPLILGASKRFSWKFYSLCVCVSSIVWAMLITYLGYTFALVFEWLIDTFQHVKSLVGYIVMGVIVLIISAVVVRKLLGKKR